MQIEIILNFLNTLFGKAVYYKDDKIIGELSTLRRSIYYGGEFDYDSIFKQLKDKENELNKYE